jgi:hypothetical protein
MLESVRLEPPCGTCNEVRAVLNYRAADLVAAAVRIASGDPAVAPRLILGSMRGKG